MPQNDTLIFRVALEYDKSIYRDIEIEGAKSLCKFAEAILDAFNFDIDHAFGFYSALKPRNIYNSNTKYEIFADMGDASRGAFSVKKTKIAQAFPEVGHKMMFLFDYGDEWLFYVSLKKTGNKTAKTKYPRIVASKGEAPEQYPDFDDYDEDGPIWGINPVTGEKFEIGR